MKRNQTEELEIPEGVTCEIVGRFVQCAIEGVTLMHKLQHPEIQAQVAGNKLVFSCAKGNKEHRRVLRSIVAHTKNLFTGLQGKFTYTLEACNVHFPMMLKADGAKVAITNFLGEKTPRFATILPGSNVEIKGQKITVTSHDIALAGQTAANIEKATKIRNRDRRVFQDGIYIVTRPNRRSA